MPTKETRTIFVIMPFTKTPKRNKEQLTAFYEDHLKRPIEQGRFKYKYAVRRSDDTFNITEKIITDVYNADIVICDLSGRDSNPNVMYELGMRLALTHDPVILIREANDDNKTIFDISGFFAHSYDPMNYDPLAKHIKEKIRKLESGEEKYSSPVLTILESDNPLLQKMSLQRAREKLLFLQSGLQMMLQLFVGSIMTYLEDRSIEFDMGKDIDGIVPKILEKRDAFEKIDFSDFHCAFSSQPMIDSYLAEQYLNNIADPEIVAPFTLFVISYHSHCLGMDILHHQWESNYVYLFIAETLIFMYMTDVVAEYLLAENEEEEQEAIKGVKNLFEQSQLTGPVAEIHGDSSSAS